MTSARHTLGPWRVSKSGTAVDLPGGGQVRIIRGADPIADAAFIVRAVNAHDDLAAALAQAEDFVEGCLFNFDSRRTDPVVALMLNAARDLHERVQAAIAKAKGGAS